MLSFRYSLCLSVVVQLSWLPTVVAQESSSVEQGEQRDRATDDRFECLPPEEEAGSPEDIGFDQFALPLDPVVANQEQEQPQAGSEGMGGELGESAPEPAEVAPEEIDAWRAAVERYKARAGEFTGEVSRLIRRDFDEEVAELRDGYDTMVDRADLEERLLRDKAITAHEEFVSKHPDSPYTARRMFRLGELYFERSEEEFLVESYKYDDLVDLFDAGKVEFLPEPPEKVHRTDASGQIPPVPRQLPAREQLSP
jgi:TolA-binding protein